jgi:hypothetical protein
MLCFYTCGDSRYREVEKIRAEYPPIGQGKKNNVGVIKQYMIGNKYINGESIYMVLTNGDKFVIYAETSNAEYKKTNLRDNLQEGDSISYNHKTQDFYIYKKDGSILHFILFKNI